MGIARSGHRRPGAWGLACVLALSGAFTAMRPVPVQAAGGTTIQVPANCPASTPGQSLVNALQSVQDGKADNCSGLGSSGTSISGPYTLVLDPSQTYILTAPNNYSDGPDGLPAIIHEVTIESAVPGELAVIERASSQAFRFFEVAGTGAEYQTPADVTANPPTASSSPAPAGNLTLQDIELTGGLAQGGAGADCGGGGAGLGGAIFSHGGSVTLLDSVLQGNAAQGGAGSADTVACTGGGGGMGGSGGVGYNSLSMGGGGGTQQNGAAANSNNSGQGGGPQGGTGFLGSGGYDGGGEGGWSGGFGGGAGGGGFGGFGGGGGSGAGGNSNGGFGGGGGGGGGQSTGGGGGFAGGGGSISGGGGGGGMGGAVFALGGSLTVEHGTFTSNSAVGGLGQGGGGDGSGFGGAVFVESASGYTGTGGTGNCSNAACTQQAQVAITNTVIAADNTATTSNPGLYVHGTPVAGSTLPGAVAQLAFSVQPVGGGAGSPLSVQPQVVAEDGNGNTVTDAGGSVSLSLTQVSGPAGAALTGTTTAAASDGTATFTGLAVSEPGTYTLTAAYSGSGVTTAVSLPFVVTAGAPASVVFGSMPSGVSVGGRLTVAGTVYDSSSRPVPGATVLLTATAVGGGGAIAPSVTTDVYGDFETSWTAPLNAGPVILAAQAGSGTASDTLQVTPASAPEAVSLDLAPGSVVAGANTPVTLTGSVIGPDGLPMPDALVELTASSPVFAGSSVSTSVYAGTLGASDGVFDRSLAVPAIPGPVLISAAVPSLGLSSAAVLAVTATQGSVTGSAVAFTAGSGTVGAGGPGTATPDLTITASAGSGGVALVQYSGDPAGSLNGTPAQGAGSFFDAAITAPPAGGSQFQSATIEDCGLPGPSTAYWWDAGVGAWAPVQPQVSEVQPGGTYCLYLGPFATATSPSLTQFTGTPFAVATSLVTGDTVTWSPSPLAVSGSLAPGQSVAAAVYARDAGGTPLQGATVYLSSTPAAGVGSAAVDGVDLTSTPQAFTTGAKGQVQVTYTSPASLPNGGTATLTAASAASNPSVSATDTYAFAATSGSGTGGVTSSGGGGGGQVAPAPVVSGINPASGPAAGGTTVTIAGSGFTGATAVDFGTAPAADFTVDSDSQITAVSPAGTAGTTVDVSVTTPEGTSATGSADKFTYTAAAPSSAVAFPDVPSSYWAYAYIETLAGRGIVNGFPDGTFRPNVPVTRAQFVKMLVLTLGLNPGSGHTSFTDVASSAWFAPYVAAAVQAGIVKGTSPTTFSPDEAITREQMAVMVARALKLTKPVALHFRDDAKIDAWALPGVEEAVAAGYIDGFPNDTFQPLGTTTRAQAAKVLAMVLNGQASSTASGSASGSGGTSGR